MSKHFTIIEVKDHKMINRIAMVKLLDELKDGRYKLEAATYDIRSLQANKYYWGVVVGMVQQGIKEMGTEITKEETHELLKARFNYSEVINKSTGEYVQIPRSTAGLTKELFYQYIEKIQQFASEFLGIVIPDPNTQMAFNYD